MSVRHRFRFAASVAIVIVGGLIVDPHFERHPAADVLRMLCARPTDHLPGLE